MARARNIKPSFFKNEDLAEQPYEARLLFIGTWTLADREGRLEDRPKKIKMEVFPADNVDVEKLLQRLHEAKFIHRYEAEGKRYIQVLAFQKHQNPHHREPPSTIPPPSGPGFEPDGTVQKPEAGDLFKDGEAQGEPGTGPSPARLIPDSGFRIPDSGEKLAPSAPPSPPPRRVNGHEEDHGEVIERIPLCDGTDFEVRKSFVDELDRLFPAVDPVQTLREIRAWNLAKPARRKTRKGVKAHITTWFGKEQDKHSARAS